MNTDSTPMTTLFICTITVINLRTGRTLSIAASANTAADAQFNAKLKLGRDIVALTRVLYINDSYSSKDEIKARLGAMERVVHLVTYLSDHPNYKLTEHMNVTVFSKVPDDWSDKSSKQP